MLCSARHGSNADELANDSATGLRGLSASTAQNTRLPDPSSLENAAPDKLGYARCPNCQRRHLRQNPYRHIAG
eukprot:402063-Alexandrium_andersonii.AAC.1